MCSVRNLSILYVVGLNMCSIDQKLPFCITIRHSTTKIKFVINFSFSCSLSFSLFCIISKNAFLKKSLNGEIDKIGFSLIIFQSTSGKIFYFEKSCLCRNHKFIFLLTTKVSNKIIESNFFLNSYCCISFSEY